MTIASNQYLGAIIVPRDGAGTYTLPTGNPVVTGTTISSTVQNNTTSDIATALTGSLAKDGQTTPTANLPLGGFKLTGVGAATARTDAASLANIQDGTGAYVGTVGGTADAITLTPSPAITAYVAGQRFSHIASGANTTAVTIAVSGLTAKAGTKNGATALVAGDIPSGALVTWIYDGTQFQLVACNADVGLTRTQTLTNKTLTTPVINSATGILQALVKRKTADESVTSSTVLQDDDDLKFAIAANEEWIGSIKLYLGTVMNVHGIKISITTPAGATLSSDSIGYTYTDSLMNTQSQGTAVGVDFTAGTWTSIVGTMTITFRVLNGANAGNITFQWAQSTSNGSALKVKTGSTLIAYRVA